SEREAFERHLAEGCATCEAALRDHSTAAVMLAASATPAQPSRELRGRVLEAVRSERGRVIELKPRRGISVVTLGWAAAAAALIVVNVVLWNAAQRLSRELAQRQAQLAQLQQRLHEEQGWAAVLSAPDARVAVLAPTPAGNPALKGRATFDPATQRAVLVFENVSAPQGSDYELWALRRSGATSLGLVKADAGGHATVRLENVSDMEPVTDFALSRERQGGSPNPHAPAGPVVMVGKLSG